ncbi:MAG: DinB family protein, partial [Terriglobales bacterium]
ILSEFRSARSRLLSRVEKIDPALLTRILSHPRMKTPMRLVDHLYFAAEHDDHHLAHIWELISAG